MLVWPCLLLLSSSPNGSLATTSSTRMLIDVRTYNLRNAISPQPFFIRTLFLFTLPSLPQSFETERIVQGAAFFPISPCTLTSPRAVLSISYGRVVCVPITFFNVILTCNNAASLISLFSSSAISIKHKAHSLPLFFTFSYYSSIPPFPIFGF